MPSPGGGSCPSLAWGRHLYRPHFICIMDLHMKESFGICLSSFRRPAMFPLPQNSHSKELPGHSSACPLAESGISEYSQASWRAFDGFYVCWKQNVVLLCKRKLCVCHHFVLVGLILLQVVISFLIMYLSQPHRQNKEKKMWCFCSIPEFVASLFPSVLCISAFQQTVPVYWALCRELETHKIECGPCLWAAHSLLGGDIYKQSIFLRAFFPQSLSAQTHRHPLP